MSRRAIVFDLDNTLIECGQYYIDVKRKGAEYLSAITGLSVTVCEKLINDVDLAATSLPGSFSADRLPRAFEAATMAACHIAAHLRPDVVPYNRHMLEMWTIGNSVFSAPYEEYPGVKETLQYLKNEGWLLVLYTKGDSTVQKQKIDKHGYASVFDHCVITLTKTEQVLSDVATKLDINVSDSWSVGDSLKDDIAPAKALGFKTVHVTPKTTWAYDTGTAEADAVVESVVAFQNGIIPSYAEASS